MLCFIHDATHPIPHSLPLAGLSNPRAVAPPQSRRASRPSFMRTRALAALRLVNRSRPCRIRLRSVRSGCSAAFTTGAARIRIHDGQVEAASARRDRSLVHPGRARRLESLGQAVLAHLHRLPRERKTARLLPILRRQRKCSLGLPSRPHMGGSGPEMSLQMCERSRRSFGGGLWLLAAAMFIVPPSSAAPLFALLRRYVRGAPHSGSPHPSASLGLKRQTPCSFFSLFPGRAKFHTASPGTTPVKRSNQVPM